MKLPIHISTFCFLLIGFISFGQPEFWKSHGLSGGGALYVPSISPHNNDHFYINCDMSQAFRSIDGGLNWNTYHFDNLSSVTTAKVGFTSDPNVLFTINNEFRSERHFLSVSHDGGTTWTEVPGAPGECYSIFVDHQHSGRLVVSDYNTLYLSNDGGNNFTQVFTNSNGMYIAGVFWDGPNIYVGTQHGMLASYDNGATFTLDDTPGLPANHGFMSFTGSKQNGTMQLIGSTAASGDLYPGVLSLHFYPSGPMVRVRTGDDSWSTIDNGIGDQDDIYHVACAQNNNDILYASGRTRVNSYPIVFKSTDGGANWNLNFLATENENIYSGWSGYRGDHDWWYGEFIIGIDVAPNNPDVALFTDMGFAHYTKNGGDEWYQSYVTTASQNPAAQNTPKGKDYQSNGLENTSSWYMTWSDTEHIFTSCTDIGGFRSKNGGDSWSFDYNGQDYNTTYHVIRHPVTGTLYAAVSSVHDLYQSTYLTDARIDGGSGEILYSTDNGANWLGLHNFGMPVIFLALDPVNNNTLYASVVNSQEGGIYKTTDLQNGTSSNWSKTTNPPRTEGHPYTIWVLNDQSIVASYSGRRASNFTASSGVFMSNNGGDTWSDVSHQDMHYWTKDVIIDPTDSEQNTWYAAVFSGWGGAANELGGLFRTTDRGQNWIKIFDEFRIESVCINPVNADEAYVSTEDRGLFYSNNFSSPSPSFEALENYPFMHPMRMFFDPYDELSIWVTSFGNGIYKGTLNADCNGDVDGNAYIDSCQRCVGGNTGLEPCTLTNSYSIDDSYYSISPNPVNNYLYIKHSATSLFSQVSVYSLAGKLLLKETMDKKEYAVKTHTLPTGNYILMIESERGVHRQLFTVK